jgi:hypothetical protein
MRRARMKARGVWLLVALVTASCKEDSPPPAEEVLRLSACLEPPTALARPPSEQLPCELLPPGFSQ